jgi:hypothetical protein
MIECGSDGDGSGERDAIGALLGAGLPAPSSRAVMVSALADARRAVKEHQARTAAYRGERHDRVAALNQVMARLQAWRPG